MTFHRSKLFQLGLALALGCLIILLPLPEGTRFKITGNSEKFLFSKSSQFFNLLPDSVAQTGEYLLEIKNKYREQHPASYLKAKISELQLKDVRMEYVNGLSPKAKRFLAVLAVLIALFILEPIPLEITALGIGAVLVLIGVTDVKGAWAPYMHPVVVFIMCCLIIAIALNSVGLTKRLGYFIIKKAGNSVVRFTFVIAIVLGICSSFIHDAAACAIGIATMLPLMKAIGIKPYTNTAKFMMISLPFACSCGGMGSLIGGGRCMVAAAFLKEFTGVEITFLDWIKYAMPAALLTVPLSVCIVYLVFRPDKNIKLPDFDESLGPWSTNEKKALIIVGFTFILWITKGFHGLDYSVTGIFGIALLVLFRVLKWEDISDNLAWGTFLFVFGGGISLGLAMGYSGAANYFAHLFFPFVQGGGWLILFIGLGVFSALVTNAMANVAAAALILPIVIPMAQLEGVNPIILALCLGMATSFAMLLVIGCPPNAIAYSYRYFKSSDLTKVGLVATPVLLTVLVLVAAVWWKILGLIA